MKLFNDYGSRGARRGIALGTLAAIGFACCVLLVADVDARNTPDPIPALKERVAERKRLRERERLLNPEQKTEPQAETYNTKDAGTFKLSRYYTPVAGQEAYLNGFKPGKEGDCSNYKNLTWRRGKGDFRAELCMNASGDPFIPTDGTDLRTQEPFTVLACPSSMLGRRFIIEGLEGNVATCRDTGGAIKNNRIDLWTGIGQEGYDNYFKLEPLMRERGATFTLREVL